MKKIFSLLTIAVAAWSFVSCASAEKMAKLADQVVVNCNPSPLAVQGGKITADVTVTYPENYFNPKAIVEVVPVIVYQGGEEALAPVMYQGEKVTENYKTVAKAGATVSEKFVFPYKEGMAKSQFELRARCTVNGGKKWVTLPTKKVADGCNITELLATGKGFYGVKDHGYQAIINRTEEGQVLYTINSSVVRNAQLKGKSVKDFKAAVAASEANERETITSVEVVAYASPDGPEAKNIKLSAARSASAKKAYDKVTKKDKTLKEIETFVKSVGEDWDGFKTMVEKSDIQDKDLIVRVLNMYNDPAVREKEIRNMASVFQELASDILPQLRRARFIANVQFKNYTDEELEKLIVENSDILDEAALLKAATLVKENGVKKALYGKAVEKFNSQRALFNLACVALNEKNVTEAQAILDKCDAKDADVINLEGVAALRIGDVAKAGKCFEASQSADAVKNQGYIALISGDYATAAAKCGNKGVDAALAKLLNGDNEGAIACIGDCKCPKGQYVKAIAYARQGNKTAAQACLAIVAEKDAALAERAQNDIEFATIK